MPTAPLPPRVGDERRDSLMDELAWMYHAGALRYKSDDPKS